MWRNTTKRCLAHRKAIDARAKTFMHSNFWAFFSVKHFTITELKHGGKDDEQYVRLNMQNVTGGSSVKKQEDTKESKQKSRKKKKRFHEFNETKGKNFIEKLNPLNKNTELDLGIPEILSRDSTIQQGLAKLQSPPNTKEPKNFEKYFKNYFYDRDRQTSSVRKNIQKYPNDISQRVLRVSPKKYWYADTYTSPSLEKIEIMRATELKSIMMNEARKIRKGDNIDLPLWTALQRRAIDIAGKVSFRTLLRILQALASAQIPANVYFKVLVCHVVRQLAFMRPKHFVYIFQAFSRLRWRDEHTTEAMKRMVVSWPVLRNNFLIKAANAISKLDLASNILCEPLKVTIACRINGFTGIDCLSLKWLTILELFSEEMIRDYLGKCEKYATFFFSYNRGLQIVELYLRLLQQSTYESLSESTRDFLETYRSYSEDRRFNKDDTVFTNHDSILTNVYPASSCPPDVNLHNSLIDIHESKDKDQSFLAQFEDKLYENSFESVREKISVCSVNNNSSLINKKIGDKKVGGWTSKLHLDLSRIFCILKINHLNSVFAGPFLLDIYHPESGVAIDAMSPFHYYSYTKRQTASSRRRQQLLRSMGFALVTLPYYIWESRVNDESKILLLRDLLPSIILNQ